VSTTASEIRSEGAREAPSTGAGGGFLSNVLALAYREATVMRHDKAFLGMVIVQPIMMLLLFGFALSNDPHNVPWAVIDRSQTALSRRFIAELEATGRFLEPRRTESYEQGRAWLRQGDALVLVVIPPEFRRDVERSQPEVQILLDGADPLSAARVTAIVRLAASHLDMPGAETVRRAPTTTEPRAGAIDLRPRFWFNATLADRNFFLATLAAMLLTNLCLSATSLGLVAERESGTFEQTLSLPTRPLEIILGKLLPYVGISYGVLALALLGAGLLFGLWPQGSWLGLIVLTLPFVLASLSIGVLVSAIARSSAQAVFLTVFFILPSMVLSGVMFPYQLMPDGVRHVGMILPLRWYQIGLRRLVSRGGDVADVLVPMAALWLIFGVLLLLIRWRMKPRLA
jgi:ABC-2 type transport system permease protein